MIRRRCSILANVDTLIRPGGSKSACVEVFLFQPPSGRSSKSGNPYGHSAVRIRTLCEPAVDVVMNIAGSGSTGPAMVNFLPPTPFLFGARTETESLGSEQGGVFERDILGVRLDLGAGEEGRQAARRVLASYQRLARRELAGDARFSLAGQMVFDFLRAFSFGALAERRNCAGWTSYGLKQAGFLRSTTMFPRLLFLRTFFEWAARSRHHPEWKLDIIHYYCVDPGLRRLESRLPLWFSSHPWQGPLAALATINVKRCTDPPPPPLDGDQIELCVERRLANGWQMANGWQSWQTLLSRLRKK